MSGMSDWLEDHTKPLRTELAALRAQLEEKKTEVESLKRTILDRNKEVTRWKDRANGHRSEREKRALEESEASLAASELARKELREALEETRSRLYVSPINSAKGMRPLSERDFQRWDSLLSLPHSTAALEEYVQKRIEEKK